MLDLAQKGEVILVTAAAGKKGEVLSSCLKIFNLATAVSF